MDGEENQQQEIEIRPNERDFNYTMSDLRFSSGEQCNKYGPNNNCPDVFKIKVTNNNTKYGIRFGMLRRSNYWMGPAEERVEEEFKLKPGESVVLPLCPFPRHCIVEIRQTHEYFYQWQVRFRIEEDEAKV